MRSFFDLEVPFLVPVWRRVVLVAVCLGWAAVEFAAGSPFWGVIALAFGGYAFYALFVAFDEAAARAKDQPRD